MKRSFIMTVLTLLVFLTACQSKEQTVQTNINSSSNDKTKETRSVQEMEVKVTEQERIRNLFLEELELGMGESEVRNLFGTSFSFIENSMSMEGKETWRYDLGTKEEYKFEDQGIDQVDMEGLKQGDIQQQLFIDWSSDGKVLSAALYMRNEEENGYYEYELLPDDSRVEKLYHF